MGGWPQNGYWLTTASNLVRLQAATFANRNADVSVVADAAVPDRVDAAAHLLGVEWSPTTAQALANVAADPTQLVDPRPRRPRVGAGMKHAGPAPNRSPAASS